MSGVAAVPIILDVDTGLDDALALVMAVRSPAVDLLAVSTVAGNVNVYKATANTLAVLHRLGAEDIPVHRGASRPLVEPIFDASHVHGVTGLGHAMLPESPNDIGPDRGPAAIIRMARQRPGEITLVCTGPLTNLAIALSVEPDIVSLLKRVVIMGGAFQTGGNVRPWAEFNIALDPDAAQQVFEAPWPDITVIGLDVTNRTIIGAELYERIKSSASADAQLVAEIVRFTFETRKVGQFSMHDPLALGVAVDPSYVTTEMGKADVVIDATERGRTIFAEGEGNVKVALDVDVDRFVADYARIVGIDLPV